MKIIRVSFFALSTLLCSCVLLSHFQLGRPGEREFNELGQAKSTEEAREQFNSYPVDKQMDIYLFGLKYIEPDDNSTRKFLVDDGEKKLPVIIQRIQSTNEEFDKGYLMEVVSLINKDCSCVTEEQRKTLFEIGSNLKDRYHRHRFQHALEELENGSTNQSSSKDRGQACHPDHYVGMELVCWPTPRPSADERDSAVNVSPATGDSS